MRGHVSRQVHMNLMYTYIRRTRVARMSQIYLDSISAASAVLHIQSDAAYFLRSKL